MPLRQKKKYKVKTKETSVEIRQKKERTTENKMYWARVLPVLVQRFSVWAYSRSLGGDY